MRICSVPCCKRECLISEDYKTGIELVQGCISEVRRLSRCEKKMYMLEKVRGCLGAVSAKGYLQPNWSIGVAPARQKKHVCRKCFCNAYQIGHTYLDKLCADVKDGHRNVIPSLGDSAPPPPMMFRKHLVDLAENLGVSLSTKQLAAIMVPITPRP